MELRKHFRPNGRKTTDQMEKMPKKVADVSAPRRSGEGGGAKGCCFSCALIGSPGVHLHSSAPASVAARMAEAKR